VVQLERGAGFHDKRLAVIVGKEQGIAHGNG
jgi:hypothetical protein